MAEIGFYVEGETIEALLSIILSKHYGFNVERRVVSDKEYASIVEIILAQGES